MKPFLKWAGGKRWFVSNYSEFIPRKFNRYIEPFLGSGAVYFFLRPPKAILGDSNRELIETYEALKENWESVYELLKKHQKNHSPSYYYHMRKDRPHSLCGRAARFIYLNRTCWNGLYRVNKKGEFNVPIGTRSKVIFEDDDFKAISSLLKNASLYACDFEELIDKAEMGDFIFVDPPYIGGHKNNSFIKYNEKLFSWEDQKRLLQALVRARERGAVILGTNASHKSILDLYRSHFRTSVISRTSAISSRVSSRKRIEELVFFTEEKQHG